MGIREIIGVTEVIEVTGLRGGRQEDENRTFRTFSDAHPENGIIWGSFGVPFCFCAPFASFSPATCSDGSFPERRQTSGGGGPYIHRFDTSRNHVYVSPPLPACAAVRKNARWSHSRASFSPMERNFTTATPLRASSCSFSIDTR